MDGQMIKSRPWLESVVNNLHKNSHPMATVNEKLKNKWIFKKEKNYHTVTTTAKKNPYQEVQPLPAWTLLCVLENI